MTGLTKTLIAGILLVLLLSAWTVCAQEDPYRDLIDGVGEGELYENADVAVVFDSTMILVEDTGLSHVVSHRLIKALTWTGARRTTALRFNYDPASNVFEPRKVVVHRKDGSMFDVDVENALDHPQPQRMIYWGTRMKVLELPRLDAGDAVEIVTYKKGFQIAYLEEELAADDEERYIPPMRGHYYDSIIFGGSNPIREKVYEMKISRDIPAQYRVYNGEVFSSLTFDDDLLVYTFWKYDMPSVVHEPRQPGTSDFLPKVVLATVTDWPEKSRWFFEVNNEVLMPDGVVTRKAEEIVKGMKTDDEKIEEILHWTAQNIRYSGISMGEGEGYTLHSGMMSLNDRCGVCKDIAGMSVALLRGLGFTVYPAMTMAGSRVEMIPADQFNHCVVAIKRDDGSYKMIDPTWAPYAMDVWSPAEAEQHYVIGSPEGEDRMAIRTFAPEENLTMIDLKGNLKANGDLEGTITLEARHYGDARLRRGVAYHPAEDLQNMFADWVSYIAPNAVVTGTKQTDIDDLYKPYVLTISFSAAGYALKAEDRLIFAPAAANFAQSSPRAFDFIYEFRSDERQNPLHTWNTRNVTITETIKVPKGYKIIDPPDTEEQGGEMGSCYTEVTQKGRTLKTKIDYKVSQRSIPTEYYSEVKGAYDTVKDFADKTWLLKKGS
ncbi:hypothetical protein CEE37_08320 [candidate division LCP-89 bacterium B3_LCP]|uniref:Transglutaminase n=1 Tax=candidate division LCP-89 bacterium B3_LCP TaxID=2012998 RepID=A0A532UZE1_UNCL8|nr:MAG: hypothetical protein CEE37_08320 [candidate division LCP-89 bacterium B3_LCP]